MEIPYIVEGAHTTSSGVPSCGVEGPNTAMELGAKTLAIFLEPFVETLISLAASRMFRVPWTFTSWAAGEGDERKKYGRCRQHKLSHHLRRPHARPRNVVGNVAYL